MSAIFFSQVLYGNHMLDSWVVYDKRIIKNINQLFKWIEKYLIIFTNLSIQLSFIIWLHASKFDFIFCLALIQLLPKQLILNKNVIFQNQLFLI